MSSCRTPAAESCPATAATTEASCGTFPAKAMTTRSPGTTWDTSGGPSGGVASAAVTTFRAASPVTPFGPQQSATSASAAHSRMSGSAAP
jgi:uncharacterized protein YkwD